MRLDQYDEVLLRRYMLKQNHQTIAARLGLGAPDVADLLKSESELHACQLRVNHGRLEYNRELANALKVTFGLHEVHLAPVRGIVSSDAAYPWDKSARRAHARAGALLVSEVAAGYLEDRLQYGPPVTGIGVGAGRAVATMARSLRPAADAEPAPRIYGLDRLPGVEALSLSGTSAPLMAVNLGLPLENVRALAHLLSPAGPGAVHAQRVAEDLRAEMLDAKLQELDPRKINVVFMGIGAWDTGSSSMPARVRGLMDAGRLKELKDAEVVGDVHYAFITGRGVFTPNRYSHRDYSLIDVGELARSAQNPEVDCVAVCGAAFAREKRRALLVACLLPRCERPFNVLVTDDVSAIHLLEDLRADRGLAELLGKRYQTQSLPPPPGVGAKRTRDDDRRVESMTRRFIMGQPVGTARSTAKRGPADLRAAIEKGESVTIAEVVGASRDTVGRDCLVASPDSPLSMRFPRSVIDATVLCYMLEDMLKLRRIVVVPLEGDTAAELGRPDGLSDGRRERLQATTHGSVAAAAAGWLESLLPSRSSRQKRRAVSIGAGTMMWEVARRVRAPGELHQDLAVFGMDAIPGPGACTCPPIVALLAMNLGLAEDRAQVLCQMSTGIASPWERKLRSGLLAKIKRQTHCVFMGIGARTSRFSILPEREAYLVGAGSRGGLADVVGDVHYEYFTADGEPVRPRDYARDAYAVLPYEELCRLAAREDVSAVAVACGAADPPKRSAILGACLLDPRPFNSLCVDAPTAEWMVSQLTGQGDLGPDPSGLWKCLSEKLGDLDMNPLEL